MFSLETTLLGVALALDAAIVSFAVGILNFELPKSLKITRGLLICSLFGFFQALMIGLGSLGGFYFTFSAYGHLYQLVVCLIFIVIGIRSFQESFKKGNQTIEWDLLALLILALATSVDALVSGISMGPLPMVYLNAIEIGFITFIICGAALVSTTLMKTLPGQWLKRLAAAIFFALGGRILMDYL